MLNDLFRSANVCFLAGADVGVNLMMSKNDMPHRQLWREIIFSWTETHKERKEKRIRKGGEE